jgi:hypothetical protein
MSSVVGKKQNEPKDADEYGFPLDGMMNALYGITGVDPGEMGSRDPPPSSGRFAPSVEEHQDYLQRMQVPTKPIRAGDKTAVYMILQASKEMSHKRSKITEEQQDLMNEYCHHLLAQNSSVMSPSFILSNGYSEKEECVTSFDNLQIMSVNDHSLSRSMLRSFCSSTSMYCDGVTSAFHRPLCAEGNNDNEDGDDMLSFKYSTVEDHRDDCFNACDEFDFNWGMGNEFVSINEDGCTLKQMEEGSRRNASPSLSHPPLLRSYLLLPDDSLFSSVTEPSTTMTEHPVRPSMSDTSDFPLNEKMKAKPIDAYNMTQELSSEDPYPDGRARGSTSQGGDEPTLSTRPKGVEIHIDENEIDLEWTGSTISLGKASTSTLSLNVVDENINGGSAIKAATLDEVSPPSWKATNESSDHSIGSHEDCPKNVMFPREQGMNSTYLPFFAAPKLFMPSDSGSSQGAISLNKRTSFSTSSSTQSRPGSGSGSNYNSGSGTPSYYTTSASGTEHCTKHPRTSFLAMSSSWSGSPSQLPCQSPCHLQTASLHQHLLPCRTESSSVDDIRGINCGSSESRQLAVKQETALRKSATEEGRNRENMNTGSGSSRDPGGDLNKSSSFRCTDLDEPDGKYLRSDSHYCTEGSLESKSQASGDDDVVSTSSESTMVMPTSIMESAVSGDVTFPTKDSGEEVPISISEDASHYSSHLDFKSCRSNDNSLNPTDEARLSISENLSQMLSDVLGSGSASDDDDDFTKPSFIGKTSTDLSVDKSHHSPARPTAQYLFLPDILDPSMSYETSEATGFFAQNVENSLNVSTLERPWSRKPCDTHGSKLTEIPMLNEAAIGTCSTGKMTDTGEFTDGTSLAGSKTSQFDNFSSSTANRSGALLENPIRHKAKALPSNVQPGADETNGRDRDGKFLVVDGKIVVKQEPDNLTLQQMIILLQCA